jgi:outer membrane receptor protein involved in Fe transport
MDRFVNQGGYFTVMNNPNLRPLRTTSYEIGFRQRMGANASLQLSAFYKETEDLATIENVQTDVRLISMTSNGDFGVIKGFDVIFTYRGMKNITANMNYEFQIARGTGSATQSYRNIAWLNGSDANYPRYTMPLDFEQIHTGSINVDFRLGSKEGPELFGIFPLENFGINALFAFNSGRPYTMVQTQNTMPFASRYETDISNSAISTVNGQITPWNFTLDFKLDKTFNIPFGNLSLNVYAWIINALNSRVITGVWPTTGLADNTGYLSTTGGRDYWANLTEAQQQQWTMREMNYLFYGQPRQIRLGARLNF